METLPTLMDLLTADLLIPLLPSLVTLATLSVEASSTGLVGVMECGVGQLQCVSVSGMDLSSVVYLDFIPWLDVHACIP